MSSSRKNKLARKNEDHYEVGLSGGELLTAETYQNGLVSLLKSFRPDPQTFMAAPQRCGDEERAFLASLLSVDDHDFSPRKRAIVSALGELTELRAQSLYEAPIVEYLRAHWREALLRTGHSEHNLFRDSLGGILALLDSGRDGPVILIDAHVDEVGFASLTPLSVLPDTDGKPSTSLIAKSMDNRSGVAVMDQLVQHLRPARGRVYFAGSTREELCLAAGARAAADLVQHLEGCRERPIDLAIVIDAAGVPNHSCEYPNDPHFLGKGPIIGSLDPEQISEDLGDPRTARDQRDRMPRSVSRGESDMSVAGQKEFEDVVRRAADQNGISYQRAPLHTKLPLTNGRLYQERARAVLTVQLPCLNMHSSLESVDHRDLELTYDFVSHALQEITGAREWD